MKMTATRIVLRYLDGSGYVAIDHAAGDGSGYPTVLLFANNFGTEEKARAYGQRNGIDVEVMKLDITVIETRLD